MPVYLDVQPRLDDRAARQVSDQATKHFADAGKTVGQQFSEGISAGLASSDAAVRKSAENTEKAYKRAADAAGMTRVEEAKLEELRTKGAGATAMLVQTEKLDKAKRAEVSTTRTAITALQDLDVAHATAANSGSLLSGVLQGIAQGATGTRIGGIASAIEGIGTKGIIAAAGIGAVGAAVAATVKGLYDLGATWDNIGDSITGRTGKMGSDLAGIVDTVRQVGKQSAVSLEDIGQLAGGVSQSLHLSGNEATAMTQKLADIQQVTSQAVNTKDLGKAFRLFNITDVQAEIDTLGQLTAASQATDVPINNLVNTLNTTGKASKEAGLNLQQTLGVLLTLEEAGVSFESAGTSLTMAMRHWAKEGRDSNVALGETIAKIRELITAGNESGAQALAASTFGKTGWTDFFQAIKNGTLDVNGLEDALKKLGDTKGLIEDQKKSTEDWHESWHKITNTLKDTFAPAADFIFKSVNSELQYMTGHLNDSTTAVDNLASSINSIKPDALAAAMGLPGLPGAPAGPGAPTTRPGAPTAGLGPNFYHDWYKTPDELKREQKQSGAPVLPYDTSLPQGFGNVPQTSGIVSAENSYMDARHTLAEKQARVTQLEHDTTAKAEDITKARNDVVNAQQSQQQAELQLYDARTSLYNKENKALNAHTAALGEFGAALDKDFGISKGLSGIADNLVRFLGNLIAAPFLSQMNALANAPGQAQGGFGAIGIAGAQGAFGPQYTAAGQAAAATSSSAPKAVLNPDGTVSTPGAAAAAGGYSGDAALLANVPAGRYTQTQGADLTKGLADCSSAVEDLVNLMDGRPTAGRSMSTGNEADWLTQHGFVSGMGGPGDFRVGFNSGHTQATLPGGTPFNWGSDSAAANRGIGGTGADDPAFTSHFYRPVGAGGVPGAVSPTDGGYAPATTAPAAPGGYGGQSFPVPLPVTIVGGALDGGGGAPGLGAPGPGAPGGAPGGPGSPSPIPGGSLGDIYSPANTAPGLNSPPAPGGFGGWGSPPGQLPSIPAGGAGGSGLMGLGGPMAGAGAGSQIGAAVGPPKGTGSGGVGMTEGGLLDTAIGLGAAAFPGVGQAAQTGIKLANRAIKFAGQAAAIGVQGIQQTFLPTGGSELANNSWFSKILGGIAGAAPALPNMAGKPAAPPAQGQQGQQGGGDTHNTTNINVDAQSRDTGQGIANDVAYHQGASQLPPGKP